MAKTADGKWKCDVAGKPCSAAQIQALTAVVKSRSNVKNNLVVNSDGTLQCSAAGKPCGDAEIENAVVDLNKAIAKGGQLGN